MLVSQHFGFVWHCSVIPARMENTGSDFSEAVSVRHPVTVSYTLCLVFSVRRPPSTHLHFSGQKIASQHFRFGWHCAVIPTGWRTLSEAVSLRDPVTLLHTQSFCLVSIDHLHNSLITDEPCISPGRKQFPSSLAFGSVIPTGQNSVKLFLFQLSGFCFSSVIPTESSCFYVASINFVAYTQSLCLVTIDHLHNSLMIDEHSNVASFLHQQWFSLQLFPYAL